MDILYLLIPLSTVLALAIVGVLGWEHSRYPGTIHLPPGTSYAYREGARLETWVVRDAVSKLLPTLAGEPSRADATPPSTVEPDASEVLVST